MTQFTYKGVKQINNRISLNMTFTFTIRISLHFSLAREFQMGNFQNYWSQNVGQDFFVPEFFHWRKILKVDGRDGRAPQNREKNAPAGRFTYMLMSILKMNVHITCLFHYKNKTNYKKKLDIAVMKWKFKQWVSDCCLMPTQQFFRYIIARTS